MSENGMDWTDFKSREWKGGCEFYPFKYEAQTAIFKDPVRTAL
jgi:hypothetical protein